MLKLNKIKKFKACIDLSEVLFFNAQRRSERNLFQKNKVRSQIVCKEQ